MPIFEWIAGALFVGLYAYDRFNTPPGSRFSTTFAMYQVAATAYAACMLVVFIFLGGGLAVSPALFAFLQGNPKGAEEFSTLPGPLYAALVMTVLLPSFPLLNKLDAWVRDRFHSIASIPHAARQLAGALSRPGAYQIPQGLITEEFVQNLANLGILVDREAISLRKECAVPYNWTVVVSLYSQIKDWENTSPFTRVARDHAERFAALLEDLRRIAKNVADYIELCKTFSPKTPEALTLIRKLESSTLRDIDCLKKQLIQLIAYGIMGGPLTARSRAIALAQIGFKNLTHDRQSLNANQVVTLCAFTFLILLAGMIVLGELFSAQREVGEMVYKASMITIIYGVAVVAGIYPKTLWRFANRATAAQRPAFGYFVSGLIAVTAHFFVSVTFKFLYYGDFIGALTDLRFSWPWFSMSFCVCIATAYMADNYACAEKSPAHWTRWVEGLYLSCVLMLTSVFVHYALGSIEGINPQRIPALPVLIAISGAIGFVIGSLVPHWYRNAPKGEELLDKQMPEPYSSQVDTLSLTELPESNVPVKA